MKQLNKAIINGGGTTSGTKSLEVHNSTGTNNALLVLDNGFVGIGGFPSNGLDLYQSLGIALSSATSAITLLDDTTLLTCTANSFTVTLPTAVGILGRIYIIKNIGAGIIKVQANGTELIDYGNASNLFPGAALTMVSTGSAWIIANKQPSIFDIAKEAFSPNSFYVVAGANSAVFGMGSISSSPTAVGSVPAATNASTRIAKQRSISVATAGSICGFNHTITLGFTVHNTGAIGGFYHETIFTIDDAATVAGARLFCGFYNSQSAPTNVEPNTLANSVGVCQMSTDGTQLQVVVHNGTTATLYPLGATNFPINTVTPYRLQILSINNATYIAVTNLATNAAVIINPPNSQLPAATTTLVYHLWRSNNATALAVTVGFAQATFKGFLTS